MLWGQKCVLLYVQGMCAGMCGPRTYSQNDAHIPAKCGAPPQQKPRAHTPTVTRTYPQNKTNKLKVGRGIAWGTLSPFSKCVFVCGGVSSLSSTSVVFVGSALCCSHQKPNTAVAHSRLQRHPSAASLPTYVRGYVRANHTIETSTIQTNTIETSPWYRL